MNLTDGQIAKLNSLYGHACKKMKDLIILNEYKPKKAGFFERRRANKAISLFEQVLSITPEHFQSLFFIAKLYQRLGNYQKALKYFETALEYEHTNYGLFQEVSLVAMHLHLIDKAVWYSAKANELKPNDSDLLANHAMNLLIAGFDKEAKQEIDKALSINENDEINKRIRAKIESVIAGQSRRPTFEEACNW